MPSKRGDPRLTRPGDTFRHGVTPYAEGLAQLQECKQTACFQACDSITESDDSVDFSFSARPLPVLDLSELLKSIAALSQKKKSKRPKAKTASAMRSRAVMSLVNASSSSAVPVDSASTEQAGTADTRTLQDDAVVLYSEISQPKARDPPVGIQRDFPDQAFASNLGLAPRASLLIVSERNRTAALLLCAPTAHLTVIPVLVGQLAPARAWEAAADMTVEINQRFSEFLGESTELSSYQRYLQVCRDVADLEIWLVELLDKYLSGSGNKTERAAGNRNDLVLQAFKKAKIYVGTDVDSFDLFTTWMQGRLECPEWRAIERVEEEGNDSTCFICFESITGGPFDSPNSLALCGHTTCADCWRAYLQSAALSGQSANIRCPAPKCATQIDLFDAAHILFHNKEDLADTKAAAAETFGRLVQTELDQHGLLERKGRFCPAANCGRMLISPADRSHAIPNSLGWNMFTCSCGMALCSDCPSGRRAHPGMSCEIYSQHREKIDSGKADGEYKNMEWLLCHTRPCPKCKFPIEKSGGCNHVWCSMCPTYFCWICGGLGNECNAYQCLKVERSGPWQESYGVSHISTLTARIEKFRSYCCSEARLVSLQTNLCKWSTDPSLIGKHSNRHEVQIVEAQLQHAIIWLRGQALYKESLNNDLSLVYQCLELAVRAIEIRTRIQDSRRRKTEQVHIPITSLEVATAMEQPGSKAFSRHKQGGKARCLTVFEDKSLSDIIADQNLRELCEMHSEGFLRSCRDAIREGIKYLKKGEQSESAAGHRRRKKTVVLPMEAPLNTRQKRAKDPWRNGFRVDSGDDNKEDGTGTFVDRLIWKKNKRRVKAQRSHALTMPVA
jgi:hypothetical protein